MTMSYDGLFTHAMVQELQAKLVEGRVMKISQPYPNEVILTIRSQRKNYPLLLSANPSYARAQITAIPYTNPPVPTNFTMMLRKYLEGARLVAIEQLECDRVINFAFSNRNELGDKLPLLLSIEIMGRHSNVILINQAENKIIDTIKHVGLDQNRYRTLLPGSTYRLPPKQAKQNPLTASPADFEQLVAAYPNREVLAKELQANFQGLALDSALYLADYFHQAGVSAASLAALWAKLAQPTPSLLTEPKLNFSAFDYPSTTASTRFESLSELLDEFYGTKATRDRVKQQGARLILVVKNNYKKNKKKLGKLKRELAATESADDYRLKGELLTTYLYQVEPKQKAVTLPNYYANEQPVTISLKPQLSPAQNAQSYFKRYTKLKNAVGYINEQISLTEQELAYLDSIQAQIELAEPKDLPDIALELETGGYLKKTKQKAKRKPKLSQPAKFKASDGSEILVGKNNLQNDRLSLKTAAKNYWWLHVKDIPGSHVIIANPHPSEETLLEAANLAAYYSKAQGSANVAVDYVQVKHLRKPNGAKPGFVIYEGQQTLFVTPDKELVARLKAE
ncbi:fibronectin-binding protein [Ligilactobacillus agilis]|uniref:Rqc2 homolog RqcH n=2 Tax=Ligilactobacillus agilis TaxID=1601 RepID=A0A6F9XP14_9LACO|nr:fibronectin-binding protein [Ligilactobacillus agilis]